MSDDSSSPVSDTAVASKRARADYVQDQLQQERTVSDNAQILKTRAPTRIAALKASRVANKLPADPSKADDSLAQYHSVERMLDERAFYPPHDKRTESSAYAVTHHQMTVIDDKPCLVCGVKHSTLTTAAENPFGAVQLETHHHTIEWALANAVDPVKFNASVRPGLNRTAQRRMQDPGYAQTPAVYRQFDALYAQDMSDDDIKAWIDHAADNLWVLCDVHHRHKFVGIHAITFPIWGPQDVVDSTSIANQITLAKSTKANV